MVDLKELVEWALDAKREIEQGYNGCYFQRLGASNFEGKDLYIVIGENAEGEICAKLAYNCDDLQCDYDFDWYMPYDSESGEVYCIEGECTADIVEYIVNTYNKRFAA